MNDAELSKVKVGDPDYDWPDGPLEWRSLVVQEAELAAWNSKARWLPRLQEGG